MGLIAMSPLEQFWEEHSPAEQALLSWVSAIRTAEWAGPADIKAQFATASVLKSRRVVFNIKGNDYRLVAATAYRFGCVYVKFIGTHREFDQIDADIVGMKGWKSARSVPTTTTVLHWPKFPPPVRQRTGTRQPRG